MTEQELIDHLAKLGVILTNDQLNQLKDFYHLVLQWNEKINLTRIIEQHDFYLKHFYDSITLQQIVDLNKNYTLCDIGSGAGFPGIVLKIVFPNLKITLLDCLKKRVDYLNSIIRQLNLQEIHAVHTRAEEYAKMHREEYDIVTARAVTSLNKLINFSVPMIKIDTGMFIAMKGKHNPEEIAESKALLKEMNAFIQTILDFKLPLENSDRTLISIIKRSKTTKNFPKPLKMFDKS